MRPCRRERSARGARERGARHAPPMCPQRRVLILVAGRRFFSGKRKREGMKINFLNQTKAQAPGSGDIVDRQDLTVAGCICEAWCFSDAVCAQERHVPVTARYPTALWRRGGTRYYHICAWSASIQGSRLRGDLEAPNKRLSMSRLPLRPRHAGRLSPASRTSRLFGCSDPHRFPHQHDLP